MNEEEPIEIALCEVPHICLKPNQLYRFVVMPDCKNCAQAAVPYLPYVTRNKHCGCSDCNPHAWWMVLCDKCGNKRCPKAKSHKFKCTGSNAPDQTPELEENGQ